MACFTFPAGKLVPMENSWVERVHCEMKHLAQGHNMFADEWLQPAILTYLMRSKMTQPKGNY